MLQSDKFACLRDTVQLPRSAQEVSFSNYYSKSYCFKSITLVATVHLQIYCWYVCIFIASDVSKGVGTA
jgi:hypothetical protein